MNFSRENFSDIIGLIEPLIQAHHKEMDWAQDKLKLSLDHEMYQAAEEAGIFVCFIAKEGKEVCGYSAFFIRQHLHYKDVRFAVCDSIYINPKFRGNGFGKSFINYCEEELINLGAEAISFSIKNVLNWGNLAKDLGYESTEIVWLKWVGG